MPCAVEKSSPKNLINLCNFQKNYVEIMFRAEVWSWQFESQINTNSTQHETPAFIPNKWADLLWRGGADPIWVKMRISNNFMWRQNIGGKVQRNKEKQGNNEHDKITQYFSLLQSPKRRKFAQSGHPGFYARTTKKFFCLTFLWLNVFKQFNFWCSYVTMSKSKISWYIECHCQKYRKYRI
jgi:hypothetical protein